MPVQYEFRKVEPDIIVASLTGQLNLGNRLADFEHTVKTRIGEGFRKMILDLSGVTFIDSSGVGMVATCAGAMGKAEGRLVVVGAPGKVNQIFEITRLNRVIAIYPDFAAACQAFSEPPVAPKA
jgi:anti-anti-sigma factor